MKILSKQELLALPGKARKKYLVKLLMGHLVKNKNNCWVYHGSTYGPGYGRICIYKTESGKRKFVRAHRLSYRIFIRKIERGKCICHKCNNPRCCNPDHLYQGTHSDNMRDKVKANRQFISWGEKSGMHKLTTAQIKEIRASCDKQIDLAHRYGVAKSTISGIINYKSRRYE